MKLLIAIVNNDDSAVVASALTKENFVVTKLSTTGGFLMVGNTTFLIGTEDDRVGTAKA
ncbi:MAG: cyclic-di-AMP receptor, partial [Clostridia bacterium]|nr:cyclic-di-AMP receptor [Clostridia bacterium]